MSLDSLSSRRPRLAGGSATLAKHTDLLLAGAVVTIIGLLVFRVPPAAMDYFLATNISISLTILLVALYIPNALRLPSFPTILLLATLFRLALNVGTTRLILLEANAGTIIKSFGDFVVGGNFVVGAVVFLVLVIVQFVVIAKGSERVAEVAARFTLDAMPGKQMSIDADLRAGLLDPEGAKARRAELERESKLYGAMDGAMKFVKGDAIAGIIISLINIVGGLIIGVAQLGMSAGEAAEVYSLLTIGDGLVSQIPALLISVSAGLVVTRVASGGEEEGGNLAREMLDQITENPKSLLVAGTILIAAGISSIVLRVGFQPLPFLVLGGSLYVLSMGGMQREQRRKRATRRAGERARSEGDPQEKAAVSFAPEPLALKVHPTLKNVFASKDDEVRRAQNQSLANARRLRDEELGVPFPAMAVMVDGRGLEALEYCVLIHGAVVDRGKVSPTQAYALVQAEALNAVDIRAQPVLLPGTRTSVSLINGADAERIRADPGMAARVEILEAVDVVFQHVDTVCRRNAHRFLGIQETQVLIEGLEARAEALVQAVVPKLLSVQPVSEVLRLLLEEQIPIKDLRGIFESLARHGERTQDPAELVERVRLDMSLTICSALARGGAKLRVLGIAPDLEELLTGKALPLQRAREARSAFAAAFGEHFPAGSPVLVVERPQVRRRLWRLLRNHYPDVRVLTRESTLGHAVQVLGFAQLERPAEEG